MPQCDTCMDGIDDEQETHLQLVRPMEFKGDVQKVSQYYCSVECLLKKVGGD